MNKYETISTIGYIVRRVGLACFAGYSVYALVRKAVGDALTKDIMTDSDYSRYGDRIKFVRKD